MAEVLGIIASVIALCQAIDTVRKGTEFIAEAHGAPVAYIHLKEEVPSQIDLLDGTDGMTPFSLASRG